ncbi:acetyl-CoA hydrolase/transferase family protein [Bryobacter aggregatus]|uniref:acetyl-CoA hydrolase/transferase family protein n=1 Tax=Bryobacter aggregatus TaxID=360054 RepID=UPI0004E1E81E|nr:acetyl-CoA hydrolase/transferase C-terminal domain-containing protein [Bryobacter aggregatus]
MTAAQAVAVVQSQQRVFVHQACAVPFPLLDALTARAAELRGVEMIHLLTLGPLAYADPKHGDSFRHNALFVGANARPAVQSGRADYLPVFLSEIEGLFLDGTLPIDVALLQCTPPDRHGYVSLGPSVDVALSAARVARHVIAILNPRLPRTHGDSFLHRSEIDVLVEGEFELPESHAKESTPEQRAIAQHVANLIPDGATLQLGIGAIPDAIAVLLTNHRHLSVHTEMVSDAILPLLESGAVDHRDKKIYRNKVSAGFAIGSRRLMDFLDDNPLFAFHPTRLINDPLLIAQNPRVCAVNAALEIDLMGQVCADTIGPLQHSGIGGQLDFIRGAARSEGGMPFLCLPSTAKGGTLSRIVPQLKPGAAVLTTRGDVQWVVTEFGAVNLRGKNLRQRAEALVSIAHPKFQKELSLSIA